MGNYKTTQNPQGGSVQTFQSNHAMGVGSKIVDATMNASVPGQELQNVGKLQSAGAEAVAQYFGGPWAGKAAGMAVDQANKNLAQPEMSSLDKYLRQMRGGNY